MFTLTYKQMNDVRLRAVLSKLRTMPLDIKTAYNVSKICSRLDKELMHAKEAYLQMLKKYAHLDERGLPKFSVENMEPELKEECRPEFEKEMGEFLKQEFQIDRYKLKLSALASSEENLTANDLVALDWLLEEDTPTAETPSALQ